MIKVLIADDSPTCMEYLKSLLRAEEGFEIVGEARNGRDAIALTASLKPDVVIMDLIMPEMDGLEATSDIMANTPTPIVLVSSSQSIHEATFAMRALSVGALSVSAKPALSKDDKLVKTSTDFVRTVRLMSSVKVVRHKTIQPALCTGMQQERTSRNAGSSNSFDIVNGDGSGSGTAIRTGSSGNFGSISITDGANTSTTSGERNTANGGVTNESAPLMSGKIASVQGVRSGVHHAIKKELRQTLQPGVLPKRVLVPAFRPKVIAIATSTGGPPALSFILESLPFDYPIPIVVVQHIGVGFIGGMVEWLNRHVSLNVKLGKAGELLEPATVYIAPEGVHMGVLPDGRIKLFDGPHDSGFRPSANQLFESIGTAFGAESLAFVLTGMGNDGADGLAKFKEEGGFVVAQDQESCTVFGMPKAAIDSGNTDLVLPLNTIPSYLQELVK